jgi:peptidoglycan DL-endopeptidase CwlO
VVQTVLAVIVLVIAPIALTAPAASASGTGGNAPAMSMATRLRLAIWHWALHQRGKPYLWGGVGPKGFDCSGLVYAAYRSHGINLPRTTYEMLGSWRLIPITHAQARRGDLAFFGPGHVELFDHGNWTFGAASPGTRIGYHLMNAFWHPTMYFRVRM